MVTEELCNKSLGQHGTCDKLSGHRGGCSSPSLKAYRKAAVEKHRAKRQDPDYSPGSDCDHTNCRKPCRFAGIPYPSERQIAAEAERKVREAAEWKRQTEEYLAKPHKPEPPVDLRVWTIFSTHPEMKAYRTGKQQTAVLS